MFYPHNDSKSEVKRDQLLQSNLAFWSASRGEPARQDIFAWEAGSPVPARAGLWVWLVVAILIGLTAVLVLAL
jgi:hypothetical protein